MSSLQRPAAAIIDMRLAAITDTAANLNVQLCELIKATRPDQKSTTIGSKITAHRQ